MTEARDTDPRLLQVVPISLERPLETFELDNRYAGALLVVSWLGAAIGCVEIHARGRVSNAEQWSAISSSLGDSAWDAVLKSALSLAMRGSVQPVRTNLPAVSVVVDASAREPELAECLESLIAMEPRAHEIVVVHSDGGTPRSKGIGIDDGVRHVTAGLDNGNTLARAVFETDGDLVAFIDADSTATSGWLSDLAGAFRDPLVMAVVGRTWAREACVGQGPGAGRIIGTTPGVRRVIDGTTLASPAACAADICSAGNNLILRRRVLDDVMPCLANQSSATWPVWQAYALYRVFTRGYRVILDPARIAWHQRAAPEGGSRSRSPDTATYAAMCLARHGDPGAARLWLRESAGQMKAARLSERRGRTLRSQAGQAAQTVAASWRGVRSARSLGEGYSKYPELGGQDPDAKPERPYAPASSDPDLTVVIPSFNRRESLARVLEALGRQTYPAARFEVVVVLDGGTDGSAAMIRSLDPPFRLKLIEQANRGRAVARNRGVAAATNDVIVFLDDDIVVDSAFLAEHARAHRDADERHVAVGYCAPAPQNENALGQRVRSEWEDHFGRLADPTHPWSYSDFCSGNSSFFRSLFVAAGGCDESFRDRNSEQDFGLRLIAQGAYFTYSRGAWGWHRFGTSIAAALREYRAQGRSDVHLVHTRPEVGCRVAVAALTRSPEYPVSSRVVKAFRYAGLLTRIAPYAGPVARACEELGLRRTLHRLQDGLLVAALIAGMKEVVPREEHFLQFFKGIRAQEPTLTLQVELGHSRLIRVPPEGGRALLRITYQGQHLADRAALPAGKQWDWDEVLDRLTVSLRYEVRQRLSLAELVQLVRFSQDGPRTPSVADAA